MAPVLRLPDCCQWSIGIWNCWFLRSGENRSTRKKTSRSKGKNQRQTESILQCSQLLLGLKAEVVFPQDLVSGLFLADRLHDDLLEREEPNIFQFHNKQLTQSKGKGQYIQLPVMEIVWSLRLRSTGETEKREISAWERSQILTECL